MEFWIKVWTVTLVAGVGIFAALSVAVIIGGAFDIRSLFRALDEEHKAQQAETPGDEGGPSAVD